MVITKSYLNHVFGSSFHWIDVLRNDFLVFPNINGFVWGNIWFIITKLYTKLENNTKEMELWDMDSFTI